MRALRDGCRTVAERARWVEIDRSAIPLYAASLPLPDGAPAVAPAVDPAVAPAVDPAGPGPSREDRAAYWLTLDAINFGSGWFPTLRKRPGISGYHTIAGALHAHFAAHGPWSSDELADLFVAEVAMVLGQDPDHELMALFGGSLNDLGRRVQAEYDGAFTAVIDAAGGSAVALATRLGGWPCYADCSRYEELQLPFLKRAQIAAADLHRADAARFEDLQQLTLFADNLVPHVLRLDGILRFDPELVARIEHEALIAHGSPEEVEIRACALHAVELIVAERASTCAAEVDQVLWERGGGTRYKASPRHRSRCTAY